MNSHHVNSCHGNIYLSYKFFIYFLTIHFHNCLRNVWRAFESHRESQVLVFTKWCDDGTRVLTFVVKLKCIVLHTNVKFSEKLLPRMFVQNVQDYWKWYCLHLLTLFSWPELLIQRTLLSFFGMVNEDDAYSLSCCGAKTPSPTRWSNSFWKSSNGFEVLGKAQDAQAWHLDQCQSVLFMWIYVKSFIWWS